MREAFLKLAKKAGKLKVASRDVDVEIAEALDTRFAAEHRVTYYGEATGEHVDPADGQWIKRPHYTGSMDAALTLIPAGWRITKLEQQREVNGDIMIAVNKWTVQLARHEPVFDKRNYEIVLDHPTAALAVVTCALYALSDRFPKK